MYVSDGYGNARVHKFAADGRLLFSWGEPGSGPGQFHVPHGIAVDAAGTVYVADRENSRIQLFTPDGRLSGRVDRRGPAVPGLHRRDGRRLRRRAGLSRRACGRAPAARAPTRPADE